MSAPLPRLTPYDTGEVLEPKLWQDDRRKVLEAMCQEDTRGDVGKVDFEDDEGSALLTVRVVQRKDGVRELQVDNWSARERLVVVRNDDPAT